MRYYRIDLTDQSGSPILLSSLGGLPISSLLPDGTPNPAALNIEFDIPIAGFAQPVALGAHLRIWGVSIQDIGQAKNLNGATVNFQAGMSQYGLPLENPAQAGLILTGTVWQAFGNWIGTDQTIELIFQPKNAPNQDTSTTTQNLSFNWKAGTQLSDAVQETLQNALPGSTINVNIGQSLVLPNDEPGYYENLSQFAQYLKEVSQKIVNDPTNDYQGVDLTVQGTTVNVSDLGSSSSNPIQIDFTDLIGQPTWMPSTETGPAGPVGMQFKTVLRADINPFQIVALPALYSVGSPLLQQSSPTAESGPISVRDSMSFTGNYNVKRLHHYGNYRQPDAESWCTVFDTTALTSSTSQPTASPGVGSAPQGTVTWPGVDFPAQVVT